MPWDYLFQRLILICVFLSYCFFVRFFFPFLAHIQPLVQHCCVSERGRRLEAEAFHREQHHVNHSASELPANQLFSGADRNEPSAPKLDCVSHDSCLRLWRRWLTASARRPLDYTNQVWLLLFAVFKLNQFIPVLLLLRLGSHSRTNDSSCKNFKSLNKYSCPTLLFLALVVCSVLVVVGFFFAFCFLTSQPGCSEGSWHTCTHTHSQKKHQSTVFCLQTLGDGNKGVSDFTPLISRWSCKVIHHTFNTFKICTSWQHCCVFPMQYSSTPWSFMWIQQTTSSLPASFFTSRPGL